MKIDELAIALRARNAWEAMDLGAEMLRCWWQPLMRVWLTVYLPVAVLLVGVFDRDLWLAILVLWWLKPLFDRFLLHVLSRAAFGAPPTVGATLRAWREILTPGLAMSITFGRFGMITPVAWASLRAFDLPVLQLERQRGRAARERLRVLRRRAVGHATLLTVVCAHFELILWAGAELLLVFLHPDSSLQARFEWAGGGADAPGVGLASVVFYCIAVSLIEPLYVAAGFALYLNRRAQLEGWDIELGLRKMAERLGPALAAMLIAAVMLVAPPPAHAAEAPSPGAADALTAQTRDPRTAIREVLAAPEFNEHRTVERWRLKSRNQPLGGPESIGEGWQRFARWLAEASRALAWVLALAAIGIVIYYAHRFARPRTRSSAAPARAKPPDTMFGLEISPSTLPSDIVLQARRLIELGRVRLALALLYRAALSALVHRHGVQLRESDTEGDCVRAAERVLGTQSQRYFSTLVSAWTLGAYSPQGVTGTAARALCDEWARHFAEPTR